jgi:hypothetical protein
MQHLTHFKKKEKFINTQDILSDKIYYFQSPLSINIALCYRDLINYYYKNTNYAPVFSDGAIYKNIPSITIKQGVS